MNIPWFHSHRQKILEQPFPVEWREYLDAHVWHYKLMTSEERARFENDLRIFLAEKSWEAAGELEMSDEIKVVVSAFASLLTLGIVNAGYFPNVNSIIVYPSSYVAPSIGDIFGTAVEHTSQARLGEAHSDGPVVISWADILAGADNHQDANNVVLHEFAHKLDFRNGSSDGVPRLHTSEEYDRWAAVMSTEYAALVDDTEHNRHTLLNGYGATNSAEFFAVATEAFFEKSVRMKREHTELYEVLLMFYGIDWAERCE
jgi:Mlc titration factor MtfA (ptsG expression regulator)